MSLRRCRLATGLLLALAASAGAATAPGRLDAALRSIAAGGLRAEAEANVLSAPDRLPVLVRFAGAPSPQRLEELERQGLLSWRRHRARVLGSATVKLARTGRERLAALASQPDILRVELDWRPGGAPPLDVTAPAIRVDQVWPQLDQAGRRLTGAGVRIADLDTSMDVTHPVLLRRQAQPVAYFDDDGGVFTGNGGEWVDLDGDGRRGSGETLRYAVSKIGLDYPGGNPTGFTPGFDWLYADVDNDGVRDTAPADGWGESSPSFGEPLLVADDANHDGALDPGEWVYPLAGSKLLAARGPDGTVYRRGENLLAIPVDGLAHGTAVAGILAGGEPSFTRFTGMAPDADLLLGIIQWNAEPSFWTTLSELAAWAVTEGADLLLAEDGEWVWEHMDGSSAGETMLTELARDDGLVVLTAAGNLAGGGQHDRRSVPAGGRASFTLLVPGEPTPIQTLWLNLNWRGGDDQVSWRLESPMGSFAGSPPFEPRLLPFDGGQLEVVGDLSPAGTQMLAFRVEAGPQLLPGRWVFSLDSAVGHDLLADAYKWDDRSSWLGVSQFEAASDDGTVTWPATAHGVIVVGAYSARPGTDTPAGELNTFSGRGAALDGRQLVDLVAPGTITFSAADSSWTHAVGSWSRFGGTSAALAHAAGVCALLLQAEPDARPDQVERALKESAVADGFTGAVPNPTWGFGKVDAAAALARLRAIRAAEVDVDGEPALRPGGRRAEP